MSDDRTISVELTVAEARALRLAAIFGAPSPEPPDLTSAVAKLGRAEAATKMVRDA